MSEVTVNVNDQARVKLTPAGVAHWQAYHRKQDEEWEQLFGAPANVSMLENAESLRAMRTDADDVFTTELHDLMRTFGSMMYMGAKDMPFEDNAITIIQHEWRKATS